MISICDRALYHGIDPQLIAEVLAAFGAVAREAEDADAREPPAGDDGRAVPPR